MSIGEMDDFRELIARVRVGDQGAASELVRRYEPLIRREVRLKLENSRLRRVLDSMDVCQSVLASFFVRTAAGEYDLDQPGQLVQLLVKIARNKVASAARREFSQRRDGRRLDAGGHTLSALAAPEPGPSVVVASAELLYAFRERLSTDERRLADLRVDGNSWGEIAAALGGTADARRVQLGRAIDRVARELQIDDGNSGHD
jgi:RNA polymerase sigma factor (sigma-70 family)